MSPRKQQPPNKSTPGTITCRPCRGNGYIKGETCRPCHGKGYIIL